MEKAQTAREFVGAFFYRLANALISECTRFDQYAAMRGAEVAVANVDTFAGAARHLVRVSHVPPAQRTIIALFVRAFNVAL